MRPRPSPPSAPRPHVPPALPAAGPLGEDLASRARRKFAAGALEQAAHILGATSASVLVAGLVGPYIAALSAGGHVSRATLGGVAQVALAIALITAAAAIVLRGLSRRANDDASAAAPPLRRLRP